MRTNAINRALLGAAAAGLGILSFAYHDFAPMWHAIPSSLLERKIWIDACACVLLAASVGLFFARTTLFCILTIGAYYLFWAIGVSPPIFSEPKSFGSWYSFCVASSSIAGVWTLYAATRLFSVQKEPLRHRQHGIRIAQVVFGLACVFYGSSHFAYAEYSATFVPAWLPYGLLIAYFTGFCHLAGGLGIIFRTLPRLAANLEATMVSLFCIIVWIPSFFESPRPEWAGTGQNQWSELVLNLVMVSAAWSIAGSFRPMSWGFRLRNSEVVGYPAVKSPTERT